MPRYTFTCVTHSHLLGGIAAFGSRLPPFLPCTPTFDDQSPAVGRPRSMSPDPLRGRRCTDMDTQLSKNELALAAQPLYFVYSFEPCGGAHHHVQPLGGLWLSLSTLAQSDTGTRLPSLVRAPRWRRFPGWRGTGHCEESDEQKADRKFAEGRGHNYS